MFIYLADIAFYLTWNDTVYLNLSSYKFVASADLPCNYDKADSLVLPHIDECWLEQQYAEKRFTKSILRKLLDSAHFSNDFHCLIHDMRLLDEWDEFRQNKLEEVAREWCNKNNIKITAKVEHK